MALSSGPLRPVLSSLIFLHSFLLVLFSLHAFILTSSVPSVCIHAAATMSNIITSQMAVWLLYLIRTQYHMGPRDLTFNMVIEVVRELVTSQGCQFILNDPETWMILDPLSPAISIPVLTGSCPFDATFCFRCMRAWRSAPLSSAIEDNFDKGALVIVPDLPGSLKIAPWI